MTRRMTMTLAALFALGAAACSDGEKATTADNSPREAGMTADSSPAYSTPGTGSALSDTLRAGPGAGGASATTPAAGAAPTTTTPPAAGDTTRRP